MARADDIRAARVLFQRALRDNVTMEEARRRAAADRCSATQARLSRRKAAIEDASASEGLPLAWWQQ